MSHFNQVHIFRIYLANIHFNTVILLHSHLQSVMMFPNLFPVSPVHVMELTFNYSLFYHLLVSAKKTVGSPSTEDSPDIKIVQEVEKQQIWTLN
jgi:hypothetical protein